MTRLVLLHLAGLFCFTIQCLPTVTSVSFGEAVGSLHNLLMEHLSPGIPEALWRHPFDETPPEAKNIVMFQEILESKVLSTS
jgi:hypothetical protein